jgi:hypothetical protein
MEIVSQLMFQYDSFTNVVELGTINFINHIKATILGLYNPREIFGFDYRGSSVFTLPPLFFIFLIFGIANEKRKYLVIPPLIFLLLLIAIDSFTLFTGVGYNRHLLCVFPLIFAFSSLGIIKTDRIIKGLLPIITIFFALFFLSQEIILFVNIKNNISLTKREAEVAKWIKENLPQKTEIFDGTTCSMSIMYLADNVRFISLSPIVNPFFGAYTNSFWKEYERAELIQRFYPDVKYLLKIGEKGKNSGNIWIEDFATGAPIVFSWIGETEQYVLYSIDLSPLTKKRFEEDITIDEIDIGDPYSELEHNYNRSNTSGMEFEQLLLQIDGIYDSGKVTEGYESFRAKLSKNKANNLVCLFGKSFKGKRLTLNPRPRNVNFNLDKPYYEVFINQKEIQKGWIEKDFQLIRIEIPEEIKKENLQITVKGRFISYSYWILAK